MSFITSPLCRQTTSVGFAHNRQNLIHQSYTRTSHSPLLSSNSKQQNRLIFVGSSASFVCCFKKNLSSKVPQGKKKAGKPNKKGNGSWTWPHIKTQQPAPHPRSSTHPAPESSEPYKRMSSFMTLTDKTAEQTPSAIDTPQNDSFQSPTLERPRLPLESWTVRSSHNQFVIDSNEPGQPPTHHRRSALRIRQSSGRGSTRADASVAIDVV